MASDLDAAWTTIDGRIKTLWEAGQNTPIAWENVNFQPPDTGAWIQPRVIWGETFLQTKNGRNTITGIVQVNVFVPKDTPGTGLMGTTCDNVRDMLNRVEVSGVRFGTPSGPSPSLGGDESRWLERVVDVDFTVDEVVT